MESLEGVGKTTTASSFKSWALQTEESYQLQLALALRLSAQAASAVDPNFLVFDSAENATDSVETLSHRFWVNGCLSYFDRIPDGFYLIHGMDPYAWTISTDQHDIGLIPSYESLKAVHPGNDLSIKVVLIDKSRDTGLRDIHNRVLSASCNWITAEDVVHHLANLVCNQLGGAASNEEEIGKQWKEHAETLKDCLSSVILPIGSLSVGLCVHRALLFKVLADLVNLPCRIATGCKYCRRDHASSCLVKIGCNREYLVDLFGEPGVLSKPDSSLNGSASVLVSSPLCHPRFKAVKTAGNFRTLAKLYFSDNQSLDIAQDDFLSGAASGQDDKTHPWFAKTFDLKFYDKHNVVSASGKNLVSSVSPLFHGAACNVTPNRDMQVLNLFNSNAIKSLHFERGPAPPSLEATQSVLSTSNSELYLEEGLDIPWSELVLKKKIGKGSYGTVHLAEWRNFDVAVKILVEQEFHADRFEEFLREVAIMKRLRHPNIVLFMGAVTQPPNLSIVTEYLSRGSLFNLLQMPEVLDMKLRLNMAYDVANGMNYLHQCRPPFVHRDLKSPNLLVGSNYTVKVCDFGLSRSKANTYLSSKTAVGTPEWMAPEVLREERSNEKSDVFSFGVILWELVTLQQPWKNLTPMQVIGAVAFRGQRLEIPDSVHPALATLIESCWADDPTSRPSFLDVIEILQQLLMSSLF
ncbi:serine/threonine-protein kinase CTR1-like [Mangifera indica]|uniref:serine/threonine-protein kinase CTR1-like n=1 Tax=Mangifera indica TaxID=29780 RepID=UPI001CF94BA4|nr:serine/threonine-protein kinase CTR1-like [Mangifera indica]